MSDTTITLLTPRGRGAVATLRFEGPIQTLAAFFTPANGKPLESQAIDRVVFGHWGREIPEEVVLCRTAEDVAEIHCHGGEAAAGRILADVESLGGHKEFWPDMLKRTQGIFQSEWNQCLSKATTARTAGILFRQGVLFPKAIRQLQQSALEKTLRIPPVQELRNWAEFGRHLTRPWDVVLGGPPNVGKSSLINALVGYARSIVYDQPGTTRDVVTAETAFAGWPIRFADTAGLRQGAEPLEAEGIERAKKRLRAADCQILLRDVSQPLTDTDRELQVEFPKALVIAHKCDLAFHPQAELPQEAIQVSSITGDGVELLAKKLIERLIPETPSREQAIPFTIRQIELLETALQAARNQDMDTLQITLREIV